MYRDRRLSISEEALGAFGKSQTYRFDSLLKISIGRHPRIYELFVKCSGQIGKMNCNQKGHFRNQCSKPVTSRDKEVNMAAGDYDDALVCCVENTIDDRIMDSGASFHATYCKEELERFKLRSGTSRPKKEKVYLSWALKGSYQVGLRRSTVEEDNKLQSWSKFIQKAMALHLLHQSEDLATMILLSKTAAGVAFGVAERLSRTFRAENTGIRAEAPKMLWADSVSTTYLIYGIPYVLIGLRIPEEEWRGKDTSCTLKGSGSDEMRYSFRDTKSHQVIRSRDITFYDSIYGSPKNDSIVAEHGLSSEITQSPGWDLENGEPESYSEALSSKKSVQWKKSIIKEMVSLEKNQTWSLVRISPGKKASQRLWMFRVKEEQDDSKRYKARLVEPSYVGALNDTSTQHKSKGFQLAGQEENLECRLKLKTCWIPGSTWQSSTSPKWQLPIVFRDKDRCSEKQSWSPAIFHQVGDEREVEALSSLNLPPRLLMNGGWALFKGSVFRMFGGTERLEQLHCRREGGSKFTEIT
ncbi:retrovirus-related pol polyprotein from transposon TNT 1-94 [Tanacetum coccineum]